MPFRLCDLCNFYYPGVSQSKLFHICFPGKDRDNTNAVSCRTLPHFRHQIKIRKCSYLCWLYAPHCRLGSGEEFNNYCFLLSKKVRNKTVLTIAFLPFLHLSVILNIPSIHIFYIMCVSSIFIAVVLCLYSKSSVVVVNNFFLSRRILFPCKNNCCIIPINLNLTNYCVLMIL